MEFGRPRRVTSLKQLEILVEEMEGNRELALGRVRSKEARALSLRLWSGLAKRLNAEGTKRSAREWTKVWNDYKCKVRGKLMHRRRYSSGGLTNRVTFTPLEDRVASFISKECKDDGATGVPKDPIEVDMDDTKTGILSANSPASADGSHDEVEVNPSPSPSLDDESYDTSSPTHQTMPKRETTNKFNDAWASINHLEERRTQTERIQANANLKQAEAALKTAEAMQSFARSLKLIAKCVNRYTIFATEKRS